MQRTKRWRPPPPQYSCDHFFMLKYKEINVTTSVVLKVWGWGEEKDGKKQPWQPLQRTASLVVFCELSAPLPFSGWKTYEKLSLWGGRLCIVHATPHLWNFLFSSGLIISLIFIFFNVSTATQSETVAGVFHCSLFHQKKNFLVKLFGSQKWGWAPDFIKV